MTRSLQWRGTVVLAALLTHQSLAAQGAKVRRGASLDLAALMNGEIRASVAPVVAGRAALGVSIARWWGGQTTYYPVPLSTQIVEPAPTFDALHPGREYMVDLYARVYPVSLSSATPKRRISGYVGGFVGFHRREFDQTIQYACTGVDPVVCPLMRAPSGSPITCQIPCPPIPPQAVRTITSGVEPGAELGVRVMPFGDVFVEIGGWARLITFADPTGRFEEGQVASRVTLAVGLGW